MNCGSIAIMLSISFLPMALRNASACPASNPAISRAQRINCSW